MEENEVKGRKVAIDIVKANIFAVVIMVVAAIVFLVPFFWIWAGKKPIGELLGGIGNWGTAFILMFVGIVVHELIHGMTWLLTKENPQSMVLDHPSEAGFYIID